MKSIDQTYHTFFKKYAIDKDSKFLVATSGGVDSMTALFIAKKQGLNVCAAHVNYALRAEESDSETELITKFCKQHQIPHFVLHENADQFAKKNQLSIQEAARKIRYNYFNALVVEHEFNYVVTAHHKEDNIETFLLNAIRGSGTKGLSGIPTVRAHFIRPFLTTSKKEIIDFATENNIPYSIDSSNLDSKYDRNFIRNQIAPLLKERFPSFSSGFELTIENINSERVLLDQLIQEKFKACVSQNGNETIVVPNQKFNQSEWYHFLKNFGFNRSQVSSICTVNHYSGKIFFSDSHELYTDRGRWIIQKKHPSDLSTFSIDKNLFSNAPFPLTVSKSSIPDIFPKKNNLAYIDFDKLNFPLKIRKWQKGDYFIPLGMKNKKKVSDYLIDEKIPLNRKKNTWIVESDNEIVWLINHRISDRFKISEKTNRCLLFQV